MMREWNCSGLVNTVASVAVPTAPPRLRNIFDRPEAAPASLGAIPAVVIALIGVGTRAWPSARTIFEIQNWSPAESGDSQTFMKALVAKMLMPTKPTITRIVALHQ